MASTTFEKELEQYGTICWPNVGRSMWPLIREGRDLMVITRKGPDRCRLYDIILFLRKNADGTNVYIVHRILKVNKDGTYWVVGDNCVSGNTVYEEQILGVLTFVIRGGRHEIPVTNHWYRAYVALWCSCYPLRFFLLRWRERMLRLLKPLYHVFLPLSKQTQNKKTGEPGCKPREKRHD